MRNTNIRNTRRRTNAHRIRLVCLLASAGLGGTAPATAQPPSVTVSTQHDSRTGGLIYYATLRDCGDATVTFSATGDNLRASSHLPLTVQMHGSGTRAAILAVAPSDRSRPYHVYCHYVFQPGTRPKRSPAPYAYALPYLAGQHFRVDQGFFGAFSHQAGTPDEFAVDLNLPEGTPVLAARAGRVVAVVDQFNVGGVDMKYASMANYVLIAHGDGTYGGYYHLQLGSARVRVGEAVRQGQQIGLSGATGHASCPHLHFAVYYNPDGSGRRSLPFQFRTALGVVTPTQGTQY